MQSRAADLDEKASGGYAQENAICRKTQQSRLRLQWKGFQPSLLERRETHHRRLTDFRQTKRDVGGDADEG